MIARRRRTEHARATSHGERAQRSLEPRASIAELFEREQEGYRMTMREAERNGRGAPAVALRALAGHANEALEELTRLARRRRVRLGANGSLWLGVAERLRDALQRPLAGHERAYRDVLAVLRRGLDVGRAVNAAAIDDGDDELATWCQRWRRGREQLVDDAADELEWFARHPQYAASSPLPAPALSL